jgi:iron complex transport system ATP-binding protein
MKSSRAEVMLIQVDEVSHRYGEKPVLRNVSLDIQAGQILGLIGPNGCGKSTLLKIIAGILPVESGRILLEDGRDLREFSNLERARTVAYIGAELRSEFPISGYDAVMLGKIAQGQSALSLPKKQDDLQVLAAMKRTDCVALKDRNIQTLSGGEKQLISLARGLVQGAKVLLLDESLSQMDLHHQAQVGNLLLELAAEGYGVVLVSHDLNLTAEWADRCTLLSLGEKIAEGPTQKVFTTDNLKMLYPLTELILGSNPSSGTPKVYFKKTR